MNRLSLRSVLTLAGALCLAAAAISAEIAWLHMRGLAATYGVICGSGLPHCPACPTAAALLAGSLIFFALAARPQAAGVKSRGR